MNTFQLGTRVKFKYWGVPPYTGSEMTGEVVMIDGDQIGIYPDEPWRHADMVVTWVKNEKASHET